MFTGIISAVGSLLSSEQKGPNRLLKIAKPQSWTDLQLGESISVNGACLTVTGIEGASFTCEVIPETAEKTIFGSSEPAKVNLERAMKLNDRLDGHIVQGHVDFIGTVQNVTSDNGYVVSINIPRDAMPYVIPKGSIALDGVSLTVTNVEDDTLSVALIPYTLDHTTLVSLQKNDILNVELDLVGKYIVHNLNKG